MKIDKPLVFLVDDDAIYLKLLEEQFLHVGKYNVKIYSSGEACIEALSQDPNVIILDYQLDGVEFGNIDGIHTLDKIKAYKPSIPVVMLSGQDKIEVAVDCMHHRATDYVVKSETAFMRIQNIMEGVFHRQKIERELNWYMQRM